MYPVQVSNGSHRPMRQAGYNAKGQYVNAHGHSGWGVKADEKRPWGAYNNNAQPQQMPSRPLQQSWGQPTPNVWDRFNFSSWLPSSQPSLTNPTSANINMKFILLCSLWYASSALSSNTGKAILNQFRYPVTLTFVQFGFVAGYCLLLSHPIIGMVTIRQPTTAIIKTTLPMAAFQVGGHIFSSMAISRVPVSTVHTIKALSPLFTVAAYAMLFGVKYSPATYISLLPLTIGVMLACTFDMSGSNALGLICAFGSAIVFVSSNIFFKKIMPSNSSTTSSHTKLDKINLLFYSSGLAFLLMVPVWLYYDLGAIWQRSSYIDVDHSKKYTVAHSITYYFFINGIVHWAQNILAFNILSSTSPVTYSIASLIKRIAVICIAIVWFAQSIHPVQGFGICLTFIGLWMYNAAKADVEKGESKMRRVEASRGGMLPVTKHDQMVMEGIASPEVEGNVQEVVMPYAHASGVTRPQFQPMPRGAPNPIFAAAPARGNPPYPSPPASEDNSPPNETNPLPPPPRTPTKPRSTSVTSRGSRGSAVGSQHRPKNLFHRRSTLSGGGPGLLPPVITSIQIPPSTLPNVLVEEGPTPRTGALPPVTPRVGNASGLPATPIPATPRVGVAAR